MAQSNRFETAMDLELGEYMLDCEAFDDIEQWIRPAQTQQSRRVATKLMPQSGERHQEWSSPPGSHRGNPE